MKKFFRICVLLVLCLSVLSSCSSAGEDYPITVNSQPVNGEIFRYYLDKVWDSGETKEDRITKATHMCIRYVAVNSTFGAYSLVLSPAERAETANTANNLWNIFGEHYKKLDVSKETYIKILTSEAYEEKLRVYFYDKGGADEISEDLLKSCMVDRYVSFRYIKTPLKNTDVYGNQVEFTEEDLEKMKGVYQKNLSLINNFNLTEKAYDEIVSVYPETEQSLETVVINEGSNEYSPAFFETVKNMEEGKSSVVQYDGCLYIIYRTNIFSEPSIYEKYRKDCLKILSEAPLQSKINTMCNAYKSKRDTALVNEYYTLTARIK